MTAIALFLLEYGFLDVSEISNMGTLSAIAYLDENIKNFDYSLTNFERLSHQLKDTLKTYLPSIQVTVDAKNHFSKHIL